jgi:hypothetical protein
MIKNGAPPIERIHETEVAGDKIKWVYGGMGSTLQEGIR